jgi:hypothetical protein
MLKAEAIKSDTEAAGKEIVSTAKKLVDDIKEGLDSTNKCIT